MSPLHPGTGPVALVASELHGLAPTPVPCPAAVLLDGELRRHQVPTALAPLDVRDATDSTWVTLADGTTGLGVVAQDRRTALVARAAMSSLLAASTPRTVLLASPRSFCAGVERAVQVVERALERSSGPVYVRKQIVHNVHVVADLESRGAVFVDELDAVPEESTVVFSAHGVSPAVRGAASSRQLQVIDATCPLVTKVHVEARRFAARGDTVILIGHAGHEEVEGTLGEVDEMRLVQSVEDVETVDVPDPSRVSYLTQTTLSVDETTEIVTALRRRFPALRNPPSDDICYATTNRQQALRSVAAAADLVLVVGSTNSSNSLRLVELAERQGTPAHLVDDVRDINPRWLVNATTIGLTAGASAPPHLITAIIDALAGLGPITTEEHETARETIQFTLPSPLRRT
ncbi:4-hydroxy-3-methylbut-2-enyl diphosphate reductase [Actinokineospora auranticolor]|uniref:4-hydroxy-3-methylbut-2-enyl diphosphate reductase n=1 Tax=Actinokineospora auranticolor TaxID=155976 RepID=A0A2S6GFS5_9PSEU|nr:4-hydroxy-3-methylbut-2-enyl diphosphate reductase [Actinokineospora auranticolor]PPK64078.1 4-hydroxy-3-methylbut-2-enyl diphosphate reductase [Actinokineospora auranticolor]